LDQPNIGRFARTMYMVYVHARQNVLT